MVSKLQLNPWNSHDCLEELREVGDAGNISTGRGNNWKMGFCSCFYCRVIMRSGIYTTAFKHDNSDNSCTGLQSATEGGLTSVIFLFYPWATALPTRQQELIWILFDKYWTKLSRGFFYFSNQRLSNWQDRRTSSCHHCLWILFSLTVNRNVLPSAAIPMLLVQTRQRGMTQGEITFPEWLGRWFFLHKLKKRWDMR